VSATTWIVICLLALGAGLALGWVLGGRGPRRELAERERRAAQEAQEQQARLADAERAASAQAARDLEQARQRWQKETEAAAAAQRAELEKLTRHLTEAYDELDRLRAKVASGGKPPDTGQGFAATMPLGDL
jgi:molecular chaperone GrpE (heat shock protein)